MRWRTCVGRSAIRGERSVALRACQVDRELLFYFRTTQKYAAGITRTEIWQSKQIVRSESHATGGA